MPSTPPPKGFLSLPPEIRNAIYTHLFPCISDQDDFCNPILSRRLGPAWGGGSFICYRCHGEALLYICRQTRADVLPIYCAAHEFRFTLWKDHRRGIEAWIAAMSDEAIACVRRFRLNAQFLEEPQVAAASGNFSSILFPLPGYIAVNLDATTGEQMIEISHTETAKQLEEPSRRILEIVSALPVVDGRGMLTRDSLHEIIDAVGWFGFRSEREREHADEKTRARASLAITQAVHANPL